MKKNLQLTLFALPSLTLFALYFSACNKDTPGTKNQQSVTLESLVSSYNKEAYGASDKAQLLEGTMEVITLPSKEVLFFLKQANQTTNSMFVAQSTDLSSKLNAELGQVKVAYLKDAIAIQDQTGQIYTFTIGEGKGHESVQKLNATWTGRGFGLASYDNVQESAASYKGLSSTNDLTTQRQ